uniref:Secreted protein n=1 Tax=Micrurus spixii TaxID=129469 RepID=A0A2D4MNX4_9SAUR
MHVRGVNCAVFILLCAQTSPLAAAQLHTAELFLNPVCMTYLYMCTMQIIAIWQTILRTLSRLSHGYSQLENNKYTNDFFPQAVLSEVGKISLQCFQKCCFA